MEINLLSMKTLYKIMCLGIISLMFFSCSGNKPAEFHTASIVSFPDSRFAVKENTAELKIPVNIYSDKILSTTVGYTIVENGSNPAKPGEDYTTSSVMVLNITNDPNAVSDSIIIKPINKEGVLTKNKKFVIRLEAVTEEGLFKGATDSCTVTIVDVDAGVNIIAGNWVGDKLKSDDTDGGTVKISLTFAKTSKTDEGLKTYPESNLKISAGMTMVDVYDNNWSSSKDIYCYYDDMESTISIYPEQTFASANFGDSYGVLSLAFESQSSMEGRPAPVSLFVEDGLITLEEDIYLALYSADGSIVTSLCAILAGNKIHKNE